MEKSVNERKWFDERYRKLGGKIVDIVLKHAIRVNTLKITNEHLLSRMKDLGVELKKVSGTRDGYTVEQSRFSLGAITEYLLGYYYIQEPASQLAVEALNPKPGELVLDCCASPGGKTTQIAQFMENKGVIVALEKKEHRISSLCNNLERLGAENCIVFQMDAENTKSLNLEFDKVLLDVECSGNYVVEQNFLGKTTKETINANSTLQKTLLRSAWGVLKNGGELVYSTCSLEPEEDELVIDWAVRKLGAKVIDAGIMGGDPGVIDVFGAHLQNEVKKCRRFWPFKTGTQGFFIAKLRKV